MCAYLCVTKSESTQGMDKTPPPMEEPLEAFLDRIRESIHAEMVARSAIIEALRQEVESRDVGIVTLNQLIERHECNATTAQNAT